MNGAALALSALGVPWALLATFAVGPRFEAMFADFGARLPRLTTFMLLPWAPLALALGAFALVVGVTLARRPTLTLALALVVIVAQPAVFLVAMYLPLWTLSSQLAR